TPAPGMGGHARAPHRNTLALAATPSPPGRRTSTSTRTMPSLPASTAVRRQCQSRPPSASLPSSGAASAPGSSSCASAATLAATIPASTLSSTCTAVRTLSPDRLSRPTTTSANTASATSSSISEKPRAPRRSVGLAIDAHLPGRVDADPHPGAVAGQQQLLRLGRAGGIEAEADPRLARRQHRLHAVAPGARRERRGLQRLPVAKIAPAEAVAGGVRANLDHAPAEDRLVAGVAQAQAELVGLAMQYGLAPGHGQHHRGAGQAHQGHDHQQFDQGEARGRGTDHCQLPMSAPSASPPSTPSAPSEYTSNAPRRPGMRYWYGLPHGSAGRRRM